MALAVVVTETFSATKVILTDATGDYDATNLGGYGSPNAAFGDYAHFALIRKKNVNNVDDEVLTLDSYDPLTATEFSADRAVDGWYEGKKFNVDLWNTGTNYTGGTAETGSVVHYAGIPYFATQDNNAARPDLNPSIWTVIDWEGGELADIEENENVLVTTINHTTAYNADVYWSKQIANNSQKGICGIAEDDRQKDRFDKIYFHIQCVLVGDQLGSHIQAQWNVLTLLTLGAK